MIIITIPGAPHGKGRPRFAKRGNFVSTYTDAKTASYENLVKLAAAQAMGDQKPLEGAVSIELYLFIMPPVSWSISKKMDAVMGKIWPTTKPDLDNCAKSVLDACNGIVFVDDKQVVELLVRKRYWEKAEAVMKVEQL